MKYIIFAIDTHIEELLFIMEYNKGENKMVLGELIKLNNLCYIKNFDLDFFEIVEDPNYALNKEGIYIYKYNTYLEAKKHNLKKTKEKKQDYRFSMRLNMKYLYKLKIYINIIKIVFKIKPSKKINKICLFFFNRKRRKRNFD